MESGDSDENKITRFFTNRVIRLSKKYAPQSADNNIVWILSKIKTLIVVSISYVTFGEYAKSLNLRHFAYFVITHCRTKVLPASWFLVCIHFRLSVSVSTLSTRWEPDFSQIGFFYYSLIIENIVQNIFKAQSYY